MDAVKIMSRYAKRSVHGYLKDVHVDQASEAKAAGAAYHEATRE